MKAHGIKLLAWYLTIGQYDLVFVLNAPSSKVLARFMLTLASRGNITSDTLRAFPEAEYRGITNSLS